MMLAVVVGLVAAGCDTTMGNGNNNGNGNSNNNANNNQSNGNSNDMPFQPLSATEKMIEGEREDDQAGTSRTRDEQFTASYTLTPTSADTREVIINFNETTTAIFGDISGMAHCTYEESGVDVDSSLMCTTTDYSGMIEWDVMIEGTYDYIPALGTIELTTHAVDVSSPAYTVTFTTPGCPELDRTDPRNYIWQGPGQGAWGFVTIVIENGQFMKRLENPLSGDLGALDFYEIEIN